MELAGKIAAPKSGVEITPLIINGIACEAIKPENAHNPNYAVIHAHGGGYVSGGLPYARILAAKLAIATGFTTYSFDYRLAPEYPYPAALEDGLAVWSYLTDNRYIPERVFLSGESAGGNLALCMVGSLMESGRPLPAELLLFSPWTDMTATAPSYEEMAEKDPILTKEYVEEVSKVYINGRGTSNDMHFSPLFRDFASFPPVYIMAGRNEILLDDSIRLKDKVTDAGGDAVLDIEEHGWHVYQQMPVPIASRAMRRLSTHVSKQVYGEPSWEITGTD
ncbi:MAG: alpha/beta hydrolase [Lachnospiraceae bacterium]|nr:alpha/beta hydrolase [Lachnospiraceae bacterium]